MDSELDYITKERLNDICRKVKNASDEYILRGLYEGIYGERIKELTMLTINDIDTENNILKLSTGRKLKVSPELIDAAIRAINEKEYYVYKTDSVAQLKKSEYPIKRSVKVHTIEPEDASSLQRRVAIRMFGIKDYLNYGWLSVPRLMNSGFITAIKELADEKGIADIKLFHPVYLEEVRKIAYRYKFWNTFISADRNLSMLSTRYRNYWRT